MSIIIYRSEPGTIGSGDHSPRLWPTAIHWFKHRSLRHAPLMFILVMVLAVLPILGCSDDSSAAGQNDANIDTGIDGNVDPVDNDGDQYTSDVDCDDNDDTIYPGVERDCASDCFNGIEACLDNGQWSPCSASTDCDCPQPGDSRVVDCPKCGWAYQECGTDFKWGFPGECMDQLDCDPGEEQDEECGMCGTRTRLCNPDCRWRDWGECLGEGVCHAGTDRWSSEGCSNLGAIRQQVCTDQCQWTGGAECTFDCILQPRQESGLFDEEVCVSGGPFIMGSDNGEPDEAPKHTVFLTPYLIDVYEVSIGRYKACVGAGECTPPTNPDTYYQNSANNYPIKNVTWTQASEFCEWDGGRFLPTEAQWEKAARGPSPREVMYPWGDIPVPSCEYVNARECHGSEIAPVDTCPNGVSYYGVFNMLGNVMEHLHDYYSDTYYWSSPVLDPQGPVSGTYTTARVSYYQNDLTSPAFRISKRGLGYVAGFRCARLAY